MLKHVENCSDHVDSLLKAGLGLTGWVFQHPGKSNQLQDYFLNLHRPALKARHQCAQDDLFAFQLEDAVGGASVDAAGIWIDYDRVNNQRTEQTVIDLSPFLSSIE